MLLVVPMTPDFKAIVARHNGARPNPIDNPAWANAEMDIAALIALYREARSLLIKLDSNFADNWSSAAIVDYEKRRDAFLEATREQP